MNEIKRQLDRRMGDTKVQTEKIMYMVEQNKKQPQRKKTQKLYYTAFATFIALLVVFLYINPFETQAPTTSTPTSEPKESQEQPTITLKSFFKQDGDVAYFDGMNSEYANFTETTTWLNEEYVQITLNNSAIERRKFYKITNDAIYLIFEDMPEMDGFTEITIDKLDKMKPISTLLTANLMNDTLPNHQLVTYPTKLNTPLQQFENVIQITDKNEYGTNEFYYAENFGLIGQIYKSGDDVQIFSLLVSINEEPTFKSSTLSVINSVTNEKETLFFSEMSAINPFIMYHPQFNDTTAIYTSIHSERDLELGIIEINLEQQYEALTVVRTGNTIKIIASNKTKLVDWSYSPNKERLMLYYSNGHKWNNTDSYQPDSIHVVNLINMNYESSTNDFEMIGYAYPIISYKWLDNSTIECVVPNVSSPTMPQLFVEWMQSENQPVKTFLAKFEENIVPSKTANVKDFETYFYEGDGYTLYLHDGLLSIFGFYVADDRRSIIDDLIIAEYEASNEEFNPSFHKEYRNAKVKVSGKQYTITADGLTPLKFTVFMDHIIVDDKGIEYIRKSKD